MKTSPLALLLFLVPSLVAKAERNEEADYELKKDIPYLGKGQALSEDRRTRCKLDLYRPKSVKGFATVVWFHGGGLRSGEKSIPNQLRSQGLAVGPFFNLIPQAPARVGKRSIAVVSLSVTSPAGIRSGKRRMQGTRVPPSKALHFKPRKGSPLPHFF